MKRKYKLIYRRRVRITVRKETAKDTLKSLDNLGLLLWVLDELAQGNPVPNIQEPSGGQTHHVYEIRGSFRLEFIVNDLTIEIVDLLFND